jgi:hypothetical protein
MQPSSPQDPYSIISTNPCSEIKLDDIGTITIDLNSIYDYNNSITETYVTMNSANAADITIDINSFDTQYEIDFGEEWRTHFPDFREVEKMCKEYPALEKALENFKTIYEMVKDDYASKPRDED